MTKLLWLTGPAVTFCMVFLLLMFISIILCFTNMFALKHKIWSSGNVKTFFPFGEFLSKTEVTRSS